MEGEGTHYQGNQDSLGHSGSENQQYPMGSGLQGEGFTAMDASAEVPQGDFLRTGAGSSEAANATTDIDRKVRFWKRFSIGVGLTALLGYIAVLVIANVLAHKSQYGWVVFMILGMYLWVAFLLLGVLAVISLIRIVVLNARRKKYPWKDYAVAIVGLALIFSPYAVSGVLSFFRISWNEDDSVSVTIKSKDPYYIVGDSSSSSVCIQGFRTSNDLKNVDINEYYNYVDSGKRALFAAEHYVETIGEEILCQVGEFYKENGRYPNSSEVKSFAPNALSDDVRAGVYDIKLEVGEEPNKRDFTILFDMNCSNKTARSGNIAVLSPLYGDNGRYCVYRDIDAIVDNLGKVKEW